MSVLSACVVQERFGLGSKLARNDAFAFGSHPIIGSCGSGSAARIQCDNTSTHERFTAEADVQLQKLV